MKNGIKKDKIKNYALIHTYFKINELKSINETIKNDYKLGKNFFSNCIKTIFSVATFKLKYQEGV